MLYKNFHKSFILLNCTIEENLKTMLTFFSENTVKTNTEIPSVSEHFFVDMYYTAYLKTLEEMKNIMLSVYVMN